MQMQKILIFFLGFFIQIFLHKLKNTYNFLSGNIKDTQTKNVFRYFQPKSVKKKKIHNSSFIQALEMKYKI